MAKPFTDKELSIAKKVVAGSKAARAWAKGEARAFGVDITTVEGQAYYERTRELFAERLLRGTVE